MTLSPVEAGEITEWPRVLSTLREDQHSFPNTSVGWHITIYNSSSRESNTFWPLASQGMDMLHIYAGKILKTDNKINNKNSKVNSMRVMTSTVEL